MDHQFELSGMDYPGLVLKIPKGIKYPFQFEISFQRYLSEEEIRAFLANQLKMQIFYPSSSTKSDFLAIEIIPIKVGPKDIIFLLDSTFVEDETKGKLTTRKTDEEGKTSPNTDLIEDLANEIAAFDNFDNIYWGKIVGGIVINDVFEERKAVFDFRFQVVKFDLEKAQISAFSRLEQLPDGLKDVQVSLKPSARKETDDIQLWKVIRSTTNAINFQNYHEFMDMICGNGVFPYDDERRKELNQLSGKRYLPFTDTDSYRTIKVLTEFFLLVNCAARVDNLTNYSQMVKYSSSSDKTPDGKLVYTLPYYKVIRDRFPELRLKVKGIGDVLDIFANTKDTTLPDNCYGILQDSLSEPCFLELIWSYWHEEAMLVQALNAISLRFQNRKSISRSKDPLASMEISHLKPLNNLLWGYIQDEQHRLTVVRRAYEYDHHYGITLQGKAVPEIQGADSRKNFLEAFHMLLYRCILFYKQDDDLTVKADAFPILNALKEVHYILSEGMHNQYGDLPFTARVEMLSQQWLLARPELREFLPTRAMVAYPETWMGPLSAMNTIQGWTGTSPTYFNMLAVYGEMLFLSVRFGNWSDTNANTDQATNWAREFRSEIQGYIHAYRTVTGVELTTPHPQTGKIDSRQPSFHLVQRAKASLNGSSNGNGQVKVSSNGKSTVGY